MLANLGFYIKHSLNDLRVNGQRTFFALLCIAAGVAAIVSLQTLAVMIQNTLTGNLQRNNRGDIQLSLSTDFAGDTSDALTQYIRDGVLIEQDTSIFGQGVSSYYLSETGLEAVQTWLDENYPGQVDVTAHQGMTDFVSAFTGGGNGAILPDTATGTQVSSVLPTIIDASVYPYYDEVQGEDGTPLAQLLQEPTDLVLSRRVANDLGVDVGARIRINGASDDFTVRGIVPDAAEVKNPAGDDAFSALFGFYYLDERSLPLFEGVSYRADKLYLRIADATPQRVNEISAAISRAFPFFGTTTTEDLRQNYVELSKNINQLVTVMGMLSLLIGSIGIVNTMQVIVRRRTVEIAVLKTIGLQANQVTILFLVEAVIMGIIGSLLGVLLGWAAVFLVRGAAERLLATELPFQIAAQPVITGVVVGVIVTTIFGFLPTLTAGQVRPGVVLRPNDTLIPKAGRLRSLLALVLIIVVLSLIAQTILGSLQTAFLVIIGAFVAAGVLYALLSILIWLVGRLFPSFGIVDLKLSLRQMLAGRSRAAMTLLALVIGVFSLSTITLMADSITNLLEVSLTEESGGNVSVSMVNPMQLGAVERALEATEGVHSYQVLRSYNLNLVSVEDGDTGEVVTKAQLLERMDMSQFMMFGESEEMTDAEMRETLLGSLLSRVDARTPDAIPERAIVVGRQLTPNDAGQPVMVIADSPTARAVGIGAGDRITFEVTTGGALGIGSRTEQITLEIIGMTQSGAVTGGFASENYTLGGSIPEGVAPSATSVVANVDDESVPELRRQLGDIVCVFVIETAFLTNLIQTLLNTFTAFPTMVAALGLIVGGVVIANSVALTTMERRREIAVMKSVGLQRERVLFMILLENGVLGLIGGLIGVGIGLFALTLLVSSVNAPGSALPVGTALLLMGLCVLVALIAALASAWGASGEKPLNVLRYE